MTSELLLVLGNAGHGKSMIASCLVKHIKETPDALDRAIDPGSASGNEIDENPYRS